MKKVAVFLLWLAVGLICLVGLDQFLLRAEPRFAAWEAVRTFYGDFRARLLHLGENRPPPPEVGKRPEARPVPPAKPGPANPQPAAASPRYLYVDAKGDLHFADTIEEIPPAFRNAAQPLER